MMEDKKKLTLRRVTEKVGRERERERVFFSSSVASQIMRKRER